LDEIPGVTSEPRTSQRDPAPRHGSSPTAAGHARVEFSVVIPTRDRPGSLARCLDALSRVDYPRDAFEVIVVDDGGAISPDPAVESVSERLRVRLVRRAHAGPAATRNAGAAEARHPYLAFIDDDCTPDPGWLAALARRFASAADCMVGGRIVNSLTDNRFSEASQCLVSYLYEYFNRESPRFFCSNNLALPSASFTEAGGFDTSFPFAAGEDRDLCDRWHFSGRPLRYAPDAVVLHAHDLDLKGFWRQHSRYGRAAARYHQLFAGRRGRSVRVEPVRFYADLVRYPFREMSWTRAWPCAGLLLVSQLANAGGFTYERLRTRAPLQAPFR
jgi:GT2 family glycosyltransferase